MSSNSLIHSIILSANTNTDTGTMCKWYTYHYSCGCERTFNIIRQCHFSMERPQQQLCDWMQPAGKGKEVIVCRDTCHLPACEALPNTEADIRRRFESTGLKVHGRLLRAGEFHEGVWTTLSDRDGSYTAVVLEQGAFESMTRLLADLPKIEEGGGMFEMALPDRTKRE